LGQANSCYSAWHDEKLVCANAHEREASALAQNVHNNFRALVLDPKFSCIGAKAAINGGSYRFGLYTEMNTAAATAGLAHDLWEFVREQPAFAPSLSTFIASFALPNVSNELEWERLVWAQLQSLHDLDAEFHTWDSRVSSDPEAHDFSFSFVGRAYFVVGLHPASSRYARRFPWATIVFNAREQFEQLRETNQFARMQEAIRAREQRLQGSLNPNLSDFGEASEARQYSGRALEAAWTCPFHARLQSESGSQD
jgi:FPC/CPF motif-containing protein YcgG